MVPKCSINLFVFLYIMRLKRLICFSLPLFFAFPANLPAQNMLPEWITGQRDTLPRWIHARQSNGMVISASDPCMSLEKGRRQAVQRALWLFTLQDQVRIQMLSDVFSTSDSSHNVECLSNKILSLIQMDHAKKSYMYQVIHEHQTIFGEVILQLQVKSVEESVTDSPAIYPFLSQSEWMIVYTDDKYTRKEYKIRIHIPSDNGQTDYFEIKGSWDYPIISSSFEGNKSYIPQKGCWYINMPNDSFNNKKGCEMKYSFWVAYISTLADQLFTSSFFTSKIQSVTDNYQDNLIYDLSREKSISQVHIVPHIKGIWQNELIVDWDIYPCMEDIKN